MSEEMSDTLTVVIHLPQPFDKIVALFSLLGKEWPETLIGPGLARIEIPSE